ncbi:MAG: hypothetical protein A3F74_02475 [Betaproteobacteria bacterium RIFCSPLOWO2_12_FULL_62_58]|nr:MAG: hypothetical protein A3I62_05250 [Betaproteobacteria bacterium RIFCSPLOWO2_02_FULL_62_79]OGA53649.1 MAG: hypothetical protein A3F74_02475 [Betaproteobacteria bacterium RIFCSPLOWO2_12_FULL_62_58]
MKRAIWILWPSFIVGGVAEAVFFTLFDPADLHVFGAPVALSRTGVYTLGFFVFWLFAAASSAFTCFLQRNAFEINRMCPLEPEDRPAGCPNRADHDPLLPS